MAGLRDASSLSRSGIGSKEVTSAANARTPDDLFKLAKNEDKSLKTELSSADKRHSEYKEKAHRIPDTVSGLNVDDNEDEKTAGFAPDQNTVVSGEGAKDNEYHAIQVKATRTELQSERDKDQKRLDAIRLRDINRNKTFGTSSTGKGPKWDFGNPASTAKTIRAYSTWWGDKKDNQTFAACWIDLNKIVEEKDLVKDKGKGFLKELGEVVAGAALGAAREAVTNVGLAISDQVARLENNTVNALGVAIDKALSPVLTPVSNFMSDVKSTIYGAIEAGAKFMNDLYTKTILGVGTETTEIKYYSTQPYAEQLSKALNTESSTGTGYQLKKERIADVYKQVITDEVTKTIAEKLNTGAYGPLARTAGGDTGTGNNYKTVDTGILAKIVEDYFVKPIMEQGKSQGMSDMPSLPLEADSAINTSSFLASSLTSLKSNEMSSDVNGEHLEPEPIEDKRSNTSHISGESEYFAHDSLEAMTWSAARDANRLIWAAADVLCSSGKPMEEESIMALMDSTRNRFYVLDKTVDLFAQTTAGQQTMEAINQAKPSQLLNKFMLSQDSTNQGMGEVLLAATCLMEPQKKFEHTWNGTYLSKVQNLHKAIFKSPSLIGGAEGYVKNLCYFDEAVLEDYILGGNIYNGTVKLFNGEVEEKGAINIISALMDFRSEELVNDNNTFFEKITGGIAGNTTDDFAPKPLWYGIRDGRQLFGEENLISMFRVNKLIPSGEVDYFQNGLYHLFFVKPDLNLTQNAMALMGYHNHPLAGEIITQLNYNNNTLMSTWGENFPNTVYTHKGAHPYFSYIFSNLVKGTNIPDLNLDVKEGWENSFGGRTQFGTTTRKSYIGNDFSITFYDTKELLLMNIITAWMKYIEIMKEGQGDCERKSANMGTIDYLGALYYFVMEPDNHTIAHWGRYVGIFPTSAPWSSVKLEGGSADIPEFSVNFKSEYHESNDPNILLDFNYIMRLPSYTGQASESGVDYIKYAELSSIYTSKGRRSTNDPNLLGGPTRSENRAYVRMTPPITDTNANANWGFRSKVPFKFVLEFESNMTAADAAPDLREKADVENKGGFDTSPQTDLSPTESGEYQRPTKADIVGAAFLDPPDLYNPNAVITYFDKMGVKLGKEYGTGSKLSDVKWEPYAGDNTGKKAIESKYRVLITNAFIVDSDSGTSHGNDQRAVQEALGGLVDSVL